MEIIYSLKDTEGLFKATSIDALKEEIAEYYSYNGVVPDVQIEGDLIYVHINTELLEKSDLPFRKAVDACQKGDLNSAIPLLQETIKICPQHAEAYRNLAQIQMLQGDLNKATDTCIDALRWNPRNVFSLILMGNICNLKKDIATAERYYQSALDYAPENEIALSNLAAIKMKLCKYDEAIPMFQQVLKSNDSYLNAFYGLALSYYNRSQEGDLEKSFNKAIEGLLTAKDRVENPGVRDEVIRLAKSAAEKISNKDFQYVVDAAVDFINIDDKTPIRFKEDSSLKVAAQMQYSKLHQRTYHLVLLNNQKPYATHLKMHELIHLYMMVKAQKRNLNKIVYSSKEQNLAFRKKFGPFMQKFQDSMGREKWLGMLDNFCNSLALQVMNCPLDLFVEDLIYNDFRILRPLQMLSLLAQERDNIKAVEDAMKSNLLPPQVVKASKIMNMVTSMHLKQLYGLDMLCSYKYTKAEYDCAKDMYDEYLAYDGYKLGEEYDLIEYFAESVGMEDYITVTPESVFLNELHNSRSGEESTLFDELDKVSDQKTPTESDTANKKFQEEHSKEDPVLTMMMTSYMLGALETFATWSMDQIKKAAFEIAILGTTGLNPQKKSGYKVDSLPDKDMSGYEMLAYFYVSWALFNPSMLPSLGLGMFDEAYKSAKQMFDLGKRN